MKSTSALRDLNDLTASQWGMVTAAQAVARGVTRMNLSRLTKDGQLERLGHGVYRDAGTPTDRFSGVKAAWLSVEPTLTADQRLRAAADAVVSGATASFVLGLGDIVPEPYEFTVPARRQTQRNELVFHIGQLASESITIRDGLPVTTPEQTIADLVERRADRSLVAGVLADVDAFDRERLVALVAPLAQRNGFRRDDGEAFVAELERLAGRDVDSLAKALLDALQPGLDGHRESITSIARAIIATAPPNPALAKQVSRLVEAANQANPAMPATGLTHDDSNSDKERPR